MQEDDQALRARALQSIQKKREFMAHLVSYVLVNAFLLVLWAMVSGGGFFWPMFPLVGWGIGLFFHGWKQSLDHSLAAPGSNSCSAGHRRRAMRYTPAANPPNTGAIRPARIGSTP
ncbi:MAG: 2TM domain-containing protein [Dehalococcoidia bacterium]